MMSNAQVMVRLCCKLQQVDPVTTCVLGYRLASLCPLPDWQWLSYLVLMMWLGWPLISRLFWTLRMTALPLSVEVEWFCHKKTGPPAPFSVCNCLAPNSYIKIFGPDPQIINLFQFSWNMWTLGTKNSEIFELFCLLPLF